MNYLILYFFMVYICNKRISGYPSLTLNDYQIDEFITQLLSSQKFDELTDIIAEKAVNRMNSLKSDSGNYFVRKPYIEPTQRYKVRHRDDGNYAVFNEETVLPSNIAHVTNIPSYNYNEKEANQLKPLQFRYVNKYVQDTNSKYNSDSKNKIIYTGEDMENINTQMQPVRENFEGHRFEVHPNTDDSKHNKRNAFTYENKNMHNYNTDESIMNFKSDEEINLKPRFKSESISNADSVQNDEVSPISNLNINDVNNNVKTMDEEENNPAIKNISEKRYEVNVESIKNDESITDNNAVWQGENAHYEAADSNDDENNLNVEQNDNQFTVSTEFIRPTTRQQIIREEGNRYYTYLTDPEYAEYHQEIEKAAKQKKKQLYTN